MRRILAMVTAVILVCSGCGGMTAKLDEVMPVAAEKVVVDWDCWEGADLELQRKLIRWYGIHLEEKRLEPEFLESYQNILAGPGGLMGAVHFPDAGITIPIFHHGWSGEGFVHEAQTPFPAGESGVAVLRLSEKRSEYQEVCRMLEQGDLFQICILDRTFTYRIAEALPGEEGCVLVIPKDGGTLRLMGILEPE